MIVNEACSHPTVDDAIGNEAYHHQNIEEVIVNEACQCPINAEVIPNDTYRQLIVDGAIVNYYMIDTP